VYFRSGLFHAPDAKTHQKEKIFMRKRISNCTTPFRSIVFLALLNQDIKFPNYISSTLILCDGHILQVGKAAHRSVLAFAPLREANSY
jgi:hypothetical protein